MGIIVIGIILAILVCIVLFFIKGNITKYHCIPFVIVFFMFFLSLLVPTKYSNWYITDEVELISFSSSDEIYVIYEDNTFSYKYEEETEFWTDTGESYVVDTIKKVTIIEDKYCDMPELVTYQSKPIETKWTLGNLGKIKIKYVLYVPEGSIKY